MSLSVTQLIGFAAEPPASVTYRYLRLTITANVGGANLDTIYEVDYSADSGSTWLPSSIMTGDSAPSPLVASADSITGGFPAYYAFDNSGATRWASANTAHPHYIQIDLGSGNGINPNRIRIKIFNSGGDYTPKDFTVKGSNMGSFAGEEVTLKTVTGASSGGADGTDVTYNIP